MSIFSYLLDPANWGPNGIITTLLLQHLYYTISAVLIAAVIAIPIGILVGHTGRGSYLVVGVSNSARAIPSLGLLVLAVLALGTGSGPIIGVLAILALPSILTGTAIGIESADREAVHAARALGMTGGQIVGKVEWPLALPLVISGIRTATLQVVATATVAAFRRGRWPRPAADQRPGQPGLPADVRRRLPGRRPGHRVRPRAGHHRLARRPTYSSTDQDASHARRCAYLT